MIDSQKIAVEVYRREEEGWMLQTLRLKDELLLKSLGMQVSVEAIYEGVKLNDKPLR
jgi:hypothetical protein